jgi:Trk K+ transport system NAD-binding subunit
MGDKKILEKAKIEHAELIISTIPDLKQNLMMIERARGANRSVSIYVTAKEVEEAIELYNAGANYVILPHYLGGQHTSLLIERFSGDEDKLFKIREEHLQELKRDLKRHGK